MRDTEIGGRCGAVDDLRNPGESRGFFVAAQ
jgi:hypothetical protein